MFKVIAGGLDKKIEEDKRKKLFLTQKYRELYMNYLYYEVDASKAVHCGIKYVVLKNIDTNTTYRDMLIFFTDLSDIASLMANVTYNQMINMFPIKKDFDGWKWEAKDYWSTKEYLKGKDLDSEIGLDVDEFLWNYYNNEIMNFGVKRTLVADKLMRIEGKQGIMEGFLEQIDPKKEIHTYTINRELGYIYDRNTGKTQKLIEPKKKRPKNIKII